MDNEQKPVENTDRVLFSEDPNDPFAPKVFVTKDNLIGMIVGGTIFIMSITDWHQLAMGKNEWR